MGTIGTWAFIVGLIIAVIGGLGFEMSWFPWVLAILGLVVGFLNITRDETHGFLLAAISLIISATALAGIPYIGPVATRIIAYLVIFLAAAVLIVALRLVFTTAKDR